ncbi:MAG: AAA family ATPase, partial [Planctomycetes bacterium]|nr:AAA family ATPase [Planctomycetota bacterium]
MATEESRSQDLETTDLESVEKLGEAYANIRAELGKVIIGQHDVIEELLIAMLAGGHCLLVGVPGLAKTLMVRTLADTLGLSFNRIQFTPDLMPADITGTEMIQEDKATGTREFKFLKGPVFANVVLADEINRTPPKTQAALLEAMQEHQVTAGGRRHKLPDPFFVLATQNPIEQEGTYPLPEAQMDRFLMKVLMDYPDEASEVKVVRLVRAEEQGSRIKGDEDSSGKESKSAKVQESKGEENGKFETISQESIFDARKEIHEIHVSENIEQYIIQLIVATRYPARFSEQLARWIQLGASPRGAIALDKCSRAHAWLQEQDHVTPDNVR